MHKFMVRRRSGYQLAEFSAALVVLLIGILIPLLDLGVIPLHWILAHEIIASRVQQLAQCKSFSEAIDSLNTDSSLNIELANLGGVKLVSIKSNLIISKTSLPYETLVAEEPKSIPTDWLPGGKNSPCEYKLEVSALVELSPLALYSGLQANIPGLTKPFDCLIKINSQWENYGRDPITKQFYMNE